jgi:uncharacterized protein (DUF2249 family)
MSLSLAAETVDVTTVARADADLLAAFDILAPGRTLLLRSVGRPEAALSALRTERAGCFEWTPLLEGPGHWEVEVHKRDAGRGTLRSLNEAMHWDHARLTLLEQAAAAAWDGGDRRTGARLHLRFVFGLLRHMRFEEEALFPEFERISGIDPHHGPTGMMRIEHRAIESLLEDVKAAALRGVRFAETLRTGLRALLHQHDGKEEKVVYTVLDRALSAREADAIVFRFQGLDPAE